MSRPRSQREGNRLRVYQSQVRQDNTQAPNSVSHIGKWLPWGAAVASAVASNQGTTAWSMGGGEGLAGLAMTGQGFQAGIAMCRAL